MDFVKWNFVLAKNVHIWYLPPLQLDSSIHTGLFNSKIPGRGSRHRGRKASPTAGASHLLGGLSPHWQWAL